ncbi:hypothetical protein KL918_001569 [Ogataea parapolymorpha]|uniref:Uncharacterized protein n=1 Tax=Ogataea parapolymorpha (strain ATCC 26012 / BCRC 20466 / JCM 22074 / NRRL Y-7560 / DL-1) TaxID=871575 RepID=W1QDF9_OGAPD|nr:hypothetical protein HPODL_03383 [Ogataea parapolymorpha DL-1]ESW99494.1 hypothetical protein HPODL_03383 [Ogataea parapolymorpha DL-1]KAG7868926.1 hypothetical protein KL918_001569 [Ogataea parapolymorpha]KAG7874007.1 hypothetical protein KL916_001781 [Ogataea parapolymorpha]
MSTQIFLPSEKLCADSTKEQAWLIDEVIRPQLPNIKENLASCMAKISENNGEEFKFPLSSHNSETLKGVISRSNFRVTGLSVSIRSKSIGRALHLRLKDNSTLILRQLLDCHDLIYNAINTISKIQTLPETQPAVLLKILSTLHSQIQLAKKSLLFPTEAYMFPRYRLPHQLFEPELPENVALDLVISNSDLSIDLKVIKPITHRPWDLIIDVPNRVSFADHVRAKISQDRTRSISTILCEEYRKLLDSRRKNGAENSGFLKSVFAGNAEPSCSTVLKMSTKYLEESITYVDNSDSPVVVTIQETCDVVTSDPMLLSITIKLDSLEKSVGKLLENLKLISTPA